jgi:hypothetical protein
MRLFLEFLMYLFGALLVALLTIIIVHVSSMPTKPSIYKRVEYLELQIDVIQVMLFEKENKRK